MGRGQRAVARRGFLVTGAAGVASLARCAVHERDGRSVGLVTAMLPPLAAPTAEGAPKRT